MKTLYIVCDCKENNNCTVMTVTDPSTAKFIIQTFKLEFEKKWQQYLDNELINVELYARSTN